jgi:hypothetical protein
MPADQKPANELVYLASEIVAKAERCGRLQAADHYQIVASTPLGLRALDLKSCGVDGLVFVVSAKGVLCTLHPNSTRTGFSNYGYKPLSAKMEDIIADMEEELARWVGLGYTGDPRLIIAESHRKDAPKIAKALGLRPRRIKDIGVL